MPCDPGHLDDGRPWCRPCNLLGHVRDATSARLTRVSPAPHTETPLAVVREGPPLDPAVGQPPPGERRRRRLRQEFALRVAVTSLLLLFNQAGVAHPAMTSINPLTAFFGARP